MVVLLLHALLLLFWDECTTVHSPHLHLRPRLRLHLHLCPRPDQFLWLLVLLLLLLLLLFLVGVVWRGGRRVGRGERRC